MTNSEKRAVRSALIVALGGFIFGLDAALISGGITSIREQFGLSDIEIGTVVSAPGFGVLFALLVTGTVCDKLGRKNTLLIIASLYLVSAIASFLAPTYEFLVGARFLGGLAFTSLSVASIYIGEIAPPSVRGKLVSVNQLTIVVGLAIAFFINYGIFLLAQSDAAWVTALGIRAEPWRWMLGVEIIPAIAWLLLLLTIPRSPRWLIEKGRTDEARRVLISLGEENAQAVIFEKEEGRPPFTVIGSLKALSGSYLRAAAFVGLIVAFVQPLTGINSIMFYAPVVFEQLGIGESAAMVQTIAVGLVSVVFTVIALSLIDRIGRRPLLLVGLCLIIASLCLSAYGFHSARYLLLEEDILALAATGGMDAAALMPMAGQEFLSDVEFKRALVENLGFDVARAAESDLMVVAAQINPWLIIFGVMGLVAAFNLSIGPIMWVMLSEVFPISVRSVAITGCALFTSLLNYFVQQSFPWQLANWGAANVFLFYAACVVVGLIGVYFKVPETKGKSIEEIEEEFRAGWRGSVEAEPDHAAG